MKSTLTCFDASELCDEDGFAGPTVAEGQPPLSGAAGLFPNATAAAPAPSAVRNPYNTLPDGTQLSSLSAMVVELLLTGQQLYPFTAASQYDVASSVNGLLKSYPHLLELSNIGVRIRLSTPQHCCCLLPSICHHRAKTSPCRCCLGFVLSLHAKQSAFHSTI